MPLREISRCGLLFDSVLSCRRTQLLFNVIVERIDNEASEDKTGKVRERFSMHEKTVTEKMGGLAGLGDFSDWQMDITKMEVRTAHRPVARTCNNSHCNGSLVRRMEKGHHTDPPTRLGDCGGDNRWARASPAGALPTCTWACIVARRWR
jgi:hypothetical protein